MVIITRRVTVAFGLVYEVWRSTTVQKRATVHGAADTLRRSVSYVEQVLVPLREAGIIAGKRGPGGGYELGPQFETTTFKRLLEVMREDFSTYDCTGFNDALMLLLEDQRLADVFRSLERRR